MDPQNPVSVSTVGFEEMGVPADVSQYAASRRYPKRSRLIFRLAGLGFVVTMALSFVALFAALAGPLAPNAPNGTLSARSLQRANADCLLAQTDTMERSL